MPVYPTLLERLMLGRLQKGPESVLDLIGAATLRAVTIARELGVFEQLEATPGSPDSVAAALDLDTRGVEALLAFLARTGYVEERGGHYENTALTRRWLLEASEGGFGAFLVFWDREVLPFWDEHLGEALVRGDPPRNFYAWVADREHGWERTQAAFIEAAQQGIDELLAAITVPAGPARLLDVGGGHGLYSARLCAAHPDLEATVFDHPDGLDVARQTIAEHGLAARMRVQGGDFTTDDLGSGYDLVLLFNVLHGEDDHAALFERIRAALSDGGQVVIMDQFDETGRANVQPALLRMLDLAYFGMLGGGLPDEGTVREQLAAAGFTGVERVDLRSVPGVSLLVATAS